MVLSISSYPTDDAWAIVVGTSGGNIRSERIGKDFAFEHAEIAHVIFHTRLQRSLRAENARDCDELAQQGDIVGSGSSDDIVNAMFNAHLVTSRQIEVAARDGWV